MANCLDGTVGVYCPSGPPAQAVENEPFYWLSDLPGINLKKAAMVTDHEAGTGSSFMRKGIHFSQKLVVRDFLQALSSDVMLMELIGEDRLGLHGDTFAGFQDLLLGMEFRMNNVHDRYLIGQLEYIEVKVENDTADVGFVIEADGATSEVIQGDLLQGINRIFIDRTFKDFIRVYTDANLVSLSVPDSSTSDCGCQQYCCQTCDSCIRASWIESPTGGTNVWTATSQLNGFVASVLCKADPEELICQFRKELSSAVLYRSGGYFMEEVMTSDRCNPYIQKSKGEAKEAFVRWMGGLDPQTGFEAKGEYPRLLKQVVQMAKKFIGCSSSRAFEATTMIMGETVFPIHRIRNNSRRHIRRNGINYLTKNMI